MASSHHTLTGYGGDLNLACGTWLLSRPCTACLTPCHHFSALLKDPDAEWSTIPELPKAAVQVLEQRFARSTSRVLSSQTSGAGETTKLLVQLQDGLQVEAVVMHYDTSGVTLHTYTTPVAAPAPFAWPRASTCALARCATVRAVR